MKKVYSIFYSLFPLFFWACSSPIETQFVRKDNAQIGIEFANILSYSDDFNVYKYRNYYNGGGVALGDVNNDGLIDVYFTANQQPNKLFLNKGNWQFEDITQQAGVSGTKAWSTGVSMVDINADGWLDIYVCNSGDVAGDNKQNELFINKGDGTFEEAAAQYNLADKGFSTHASFFDYDKDGDLDVYLLNNSYQAIGTFDLRRNERPKRDVLGGDKLMENQNGTFVDVSEQAGIYGSVIGFGLGVTVGDVNGDGWEDLFISNDFFERDYLYINQQDGTFEEVLTEQMRSISGASMGADLADLDNDGYNDLFVTEMLPKEYNRLKTVTTFEDWNKYQYNVKNGYGHQFTRNMLHRNNTNGTFSELGRFAGVEASDWSWGALFFDMDQDGKRDLFIANGIYQDLTDQDYLQYVSNEEVIKAIVTKSKVDYKRLIDIIPSEKVPNQSYRNLGDFQFESYTNSGLEEASFSNGAAYGDLDNDGDLDLVVNNVNMPAFVYENTAPKGNALQIQFQGADKNNNAFGARVTVFTPTTTLYAEQQPLRGFQSTMDPRLHIGLGDATTMAVLVEWPTGGHTYLSDVQANNLLFLKEAEKNPAPWEQQQQEVTAIFQTAEQSIPYTHRENNFVDFHRERLTYHMCSNEGPKTTYTDFNADGYADLVIPGAKGYATTILWGSAKGYQKKNTNTALLQSLKASEHTQALAFDANNDSYLDVYLTSGGVEVTPFSTAIYDHLLLNDGAGKFTLSPQQLPAHALKISTGAVAHADVDGDGDQDLFVGERLKIGAYGLPGSGYVLHNDGQGNFTVHTATLEAFKDLGLITAATFFDMDQDTDPDLVVVGEFMGIHIYENQAGVFTLKKDHPLCRKKGWWSALLKKDLDGDGDLDLVVGNHGKNSRFRASAAQPIKMYLNDFDQNGSVEGILTFTDTSGRDFPYALRHNLIDQMKGLKKKFPDYQSFRDADITKIIDPPALRKAQIQEVNFLESVVLENKGNFNFSLHPLAAEAQLSPVYAIAADDFDRDGDMDLVLGGNQYRAKPEVGIYDASYGTYLEQTDSLRFRASKQQKGLSVKGEIRDLKISPQGLLVIRNNDSIVEVKY